MHVQFGRNTRMIRTRPGRYTGLADLRQRSNFPAKGASVPPELRSRSQTSCGVRFLVARTSSSRAVKSARRVTDAFQSSSFGCAMQCRFERTAHGGALSRASVSNTAASEQEGILRLPCSPHTQRARARRCHEQQLRPTAHQPGGEIQFIRIGAKNRTRSTSQARGTYARTAQQGARGICGRQAGRQRTRIAPD